MRSVNEGCYDELVALGFKGYVRFVNGDRVDDTYEADPDFVRAAASMPSSHKDLLRHCEPMQRAVVEAYRASPRSSDAVAVLLDAAAAYHEPIEARARALIARVGGPAFVPAATALLFVMVALASVDGR